MSFGDQKVVLPLLPIRDRPGTFHAWLVPTRAGTYTFRITGKVKGQAIDTTSTCSDKTFDCVVDAAELQFPAKDPSAGQLADGLGRALPRTERAMDTAARARTVAIAAMVVAALSLVTTIALALRKGRADH